MRVPSCATRWRSMRSCFISRARTCRDVDDQLGEDVTVVAAEVVDAARGCRDADAAAQPAVGGVQLDEPGDLATRSDAVTGRVDPQAEEPDLGSTGSVADAPAISPRARTSA